MRMRKKKHGAERMEKVSSLFIRNGLDLTGKIYLEIGCGKGGFVRGLAETEKEAHIVAMEKITDVILLAAEALPAEIQNVSFLNRDAKDLEELFRPCSIDRIYLNFSDPWPKAGHFKRRLTYRGFLAVYRKLLKEDGKLIFKTDSRALFDFSLSELRLSGWEIENVTYDLHHSPWMNGNIETEYEKNFSAKGFPIHRAEARPLPLDPPEKTENEVQERNYV